LETVDFAAHKLLRFTVLIPHRDNNRILGDYRRSLFGAGLAGAYSFPAVTPLAVVSRLLSIGELKECALALRKLSLPKDGKISAVSTEIMPCPGGPADFFGLLLDLPLRGFKFENPKVLYRFPKAVLCAALLERGGAAALPDSLPQAPQISFRAAMLANLQIRPLPEGAGPYSLEWKLSSQVWLPKA
jgi:hypothetical protein